MTMRGRVATFYSFKGGVGRSFAVANVAAALAQWGAKVLCIDWDIEAPGLDHYFAPYTRETAPGLVDVLAGFAKDPGAGLRWQDHVSAVVLPHGHAISLMHAGTPGPLYAEQLRSLDWAAMYQDGLGGRLEEMFEELRGRYDLVLIDSRTGITEFGGIVTAQLPDVLVCMFTANEQSVGGIDHIATRSAEIRDALPLARSRLPVLPVTTRFDDRVEKDRSDRWRGRIAERLGKFVEPWIERDTPVTTLLDMLTVPYVPYWSFGEELAMTRPTRSLEGGVEDVMETIAALLLKRLDATGMLSRSRASYIASGRRTAARLHRQVRDVFLDGGTAEERAALNAGLARAGLTAWNEQGTAQDEALNLSRALLVIGEVSDTGRPLERFRSQSLDDGRERPVAVIRRFGATPGAAIEATSEVRYFELDGGEADRIAAHMLALLEPGKGRLIESAGVRPGASEGERALVQGDVVRAIEAFRREREDLRLASATAGDDDAGRLRGLWAGARLGDALLAAGDLAGALEAYRDAESGSIRAVPPTDRLRWQRLQLGLRDRIGRALLAQGNLRDAQTAFDAGLALSARLSAAYPDDTTVAGSEAALHAGVGDVLVAQGDLAGGLDAYRAGMAVTERLVRSDAGNTIWQREQSVSHGRLGDVLVAQGDLVGALDAYRAVMVIAERLARLEPSNAEWQRDLSVSHGKIGDVLRAQGDLAGALDAYRANMAIAERLARSDAGNAEWQRDLSVSHNKIGDVLMSRGDLAGALGVYRAGMAITERLARSNAGNAEWQRDLSVSHGSIGDVLVAQGDQSGALDAYRAGMAIAERLAQSDTGNAGWQRDLSVSHNKIGDVLLARGDLAEALDAYSASIAIRERMTRSDPGNAEWQRDVSVSHEKVGDVLAAQREFGGALGAYGAGMAIRERLARSDLSNARWQRDLSVLHYKTGDMLMAKGDQAEALDAYRAGMAIAERLTRSDAGNAGWWRDLSVSHIKVGDVLMAQGDFAGALEIFRAGMAIAERLARSDAGNAVWQRDLAVAWGRVADTLVRLEQTDEARVVARRALDQVLLCIERFPGDPEGERIRPYFEDLLRRAGG